MRLLDYATPTPRRPGWKMKIVYGLLLAANGITLLIGLAAAYQVFQHNDWNRVSGYWLAEWARS